MATLRFQKKRIVKITFYDNKNNKIDEQTQPIAENGVCNFDNVKTQLSKICDNKNITLSKRIQICVNRNDMSARLLQPPDLIWTSRNYISYYEYNEETSILEKKKIEKKEKNSLWIQSSGINGPLDIITKFWIHPKEGRIEFMLVDNPIIEEDSNSIELEEEKIDRIDENRENKTEEFEKLSLNSSPIKIEEENNTNENNRIYSINSTISNY